MTESSNDPPASGGKLTRQQVITVTAALVALLMAAAALAVSLAKPWQQDTVDDYIEQSSIANKSILRVGVFADAPGSSELKRGDGKRLSDFEGFDIEIVRALARYLGYVEESIAPVITDTHQRPRQLAENSAEIVVANYSMTADRENTVDFAGPYLISKLSVLVRKEDGGKEPGSSYTLTDLLKLRLCTTAGSTSESELRTKGILNFTPAARHEDCAEGVHQKKFDAFVLDDVILAGYYARHPDDLMLVDLATERFEKYGIAVTNGDEHLRQVINNFLLDSYERGDDGAWQRAWNRTLGQVPFMQDKSQPRPENVVKLRDYQDRYQVAADPRGGARDTLLACPVLPLRSRR